MKDNLNTTPAATATAKTKDASEKYDLGTLLVTGMLCLTVGMGASMALEYVLKDDTKPLSSYEVKTKAAADAMSFEERAALVASWTEDAVNNIDPATEHRVKFVEMAEWFSEDGIIEAGEYTLLKGGYDQLKGYKHTNDINQQANAMREREGIQGKSTIVIDDVES